MEVVEVAMTVTEHTYMHEEELEALMTAFGPLEATRFLTLPRDHTMDAVQRHREWQANLDQQQFFDQVFGADAR